jgi:hypothetical protein
MRRLAPLLLAFVLALPGCGTPTAPLARIALGQPFWLGSGRTAIMADGALAVRFLRVVEDSRCPQGALCIWAGDVIVELGVTRPADTEVKVQLSAFLDPRSATVSGYRIDLIGVEPVTRSWEAVPASAYRVQLMVTAIR